jgi:hypothetical protein
LISTLKILRCLVLAILAGVAQPVLAQGFMVKPMRLEAAPRPSSVVELPVQVWNTSGESARDVELKLVELSQSSIGTWKVVDPGQDPLVGHSSALSWTSIADSRVTIDPLQPIEFMVRLQPPSDARGAYFVGVVIEEPRPEGATGITVRTRFLVPLIIQIQGRTVRQKIALQDGGMLYGPSDVPGEMTTSAFVEVVNSGQSYSRLKGSVRIDRRDGDEWRSVTRVDLDERSIIPGVTLQLGRDLQRHLPSGTYRIHGELLVDGRRIAPFEKELEFEGDPATSAIAYDTSLMLDPALIDVEIVPGATRTTVLTIENPGSEAVSVDIASIVPKGLVGVEMGTFRGTDVSAAEWTSVRPSAFTLRPGRTQRVRVVSSVPKGELLHPNYYADLVLTGTYPDGQSAGETRSTIRLANDAAETVVNGSISSVTMAEGDAAKFVVQVRFVNAGNIHLTPTAQVALLTPQGGSVLGSRLEGEARPLLPLGRRDFSGELDFSGVEPGSYVLRSVVSIGDGRDVVKQMVATVELATDGEGTTETVPVVTLLDPESGPVPDMTTGRAEVDAIEAGNDA